MSMIFCQCNHWSLYGMMVRKCTFNFCFLTLMTLDFSNLQDRKVKSRIILLLNFKKCDNDVIIP